MSDTLKKEALEFARAYKISHLATVEEGRPRSRVMSAPRIEDDFTIWYVTHASYNKVRQINACPEVFITFYDGKKEVYVSGKGMVVEDPGIKHDFWQEEWKKFFPQGPDDPEYALLKVTPEEVEYRDMQKHGFELQKII